MTTKNNEVTFWLEKPKALGWRGVSLLVPCIASVIGFCSFGVLGFSFTELATLPQGFRTGLVLLGSFSLAVGGEVGTLSSVIEMFRVGEKLRKWDKVALVISVLATVSSFLLAFSALLGATNTWASWLKVYGPVLLGVISALDAYGSLLEMGQYLNTFDKRMKQWQTAFEQFKKEQVTYQVDTQRRINEHRVNTALQQETAEKVLTTESNEQPKADIETARSVKQGNDALQQAQRFEQIINTFRDNPKASVTSLASVLSVSRNTVYRDIETLKDTGRLTKNGKGYIVTL